MGCNPEEGSIREITEAFSQEEAIEKGFTEFFKIGELIQIKNIYFEVNNFVESHGFMNLKIVKNLDALKRLSSLFPEGKILTRNFEDD